MDRHHQRERTYYTFIHICTTYRTQVPNNKSRVDTTLKHALHTLCYFQLYPFKVSAEVCIFMIVENSTATNSEEAAT